MTSSTSVTSTAYPSRQAWWHPAEVMLVTGPGTTPTGRAYSAAVRAVLSDPERRPASTTTVPAVIVAMSRLRVRNRDRVGALPGSYL